jgi:hypothetical protein
VNEQLIGFQRHVQNAGTKRRLQVEISQVGNFAGWNFAGWNIAGSQELCRLIMQT